MSQKKLKRERVDLGVDRTSNHPLVTRTVGTFPVSPPPRKIMVMAIRAIRVRVRARVSIRVNPNPNSLNSPNNFPWGLTGNYRTVTVCYDEWQIGTITQYNTKLDECHILYADKSEDYLKLDDFNGVDVILID